MAAEGTKRYDYRIPFSASKQKADFELDKKVLVVFDTDYKSVDELIEEKNWINQHNLKNKK